jgi:hypothetical protein
MDVPRIAKQEDPNATEHIGDAVVNVSATRMSPCRSTSGRISSNLNNFRETAALTKTKNLIILVLLN